MKTKEQLARECGVSPKTIQRDALFAEQVDRIAANCGQEAKRWILSPDACLTRRQVAWLADQGPNDQRAFPEAVAREGKPPSWGRAGGRRGFVVPADPLALAAAVLDKIGLENGTQAATAMLRIAEERRQAAVQGLAGDPER